ncbi:hypothetical protein [Specibacter sp. RAF43]|uniref:hypothetical protein n=1 Tax=Specibacter sp. RAF43 TaxID=3233057 RepID=UPI003F984400
MKVLVVDDDRGSLLVAQAAVEQSGHECIVAADATPGGASTRTITRTWWSVT